MKIPERVNILADGKVFNKLLEEARMKYEQISSDLEER